MVAWLSALVVAVVVIVVFSTTKAGQRVVAGLGLNRLVKDGAPQDDRDYLLRVCGNDPAEVERRLAAERAKNRDLPNAQIYRNAIRTHMNARPTEARSE